MASDSLTKSQECSKNLPPTAKTVILHTIHHPNGRSVAFGIAGDQSENDDVTPVLFFYPMGANRRMLQYLHAAATTSKLKLICVNRPGKGGTSKAGKTGVATHVATTCDDACFVLDWLGIVCASLLFMCAGTPFALAFATQNPERTTGKLMGVASWVLPADCGACNTKYAFRIGTCFPSVFGHLIGNIMSCMSDSVASLPHTWVTRGVRDKLSDEESNIFEELFDSTEFVEMMLWMGEERGGASEDISVLLSTCKDAGIEYEKIPGDTVVFWHGEKDTLVPIAGVKWLSERIPLSVLRSLPEGTHQGSLFLLHFSILDSMKFLVA